MSAAKLYSKDKPVVSCIHILSLQEGKMSNLGHYLVTSSDLYLLDIHFFKEEEKTGVYPKKFLPPNQANFFSVANSSPPSLGPDNTSHAPKYLRLKSSKLQILLVC